MRARSDLSRKRGKVAPAAKPTGLAFGWPRSEPYVPPQARREGAPLPTRRPVTAAYFGNSRQTSVSLPQNSIHLAWSIGPLPTTLANKKSAI